jgi:predicted RNA-binding Zn-ribbon protein involved in translation (DUF1610 family)
MWSLDYFKKLRVKEKPLKWKCEHCGSYNIKWLAESWFGQHCQCNSCGMDFYVNE